MGGCYIKSLKSLFSLILELNQRFWLIQVVVTLIVLLPVGKLCFVLAIHGVNMAGKENRTAQS